MERLQENIPNEKLNKELYPSGYRQMLNLGSYLEDEGPRMFVTNKEHGSLLDQVAF